MKVEKAERERLRSRFILKLILQGVDAMIHKVCTPPLDLLPLQAPVLRLLPEHPHYQSITQEWKRREAGHRGELQLTEDLSVLEPGR
ncbi:hypothetical protein [Salsuginibacillus kocurii]|uniref:hypothetical protein n=1 Tax=Salsuginibacillus kocurii TaxID=427078 RepID=UPI000369E449|nr:hypothetical protein [Salsuginibacillus kocurii]